MASKAQISQYHDRGYFIVDDAVDAALLQELAAAADRVAARVRSGEVVDDPDGIHLGGEAVEPAFISGLVAPEFAEPAFAQYLASEPIARYLQSFTKPLSASLIFLGLISSGSGAPSPTRLLVMVSTRVYSCF